jgi:TIGR03009 family protein
MRTSWLALGASLLVVVSVIGQPPASPPLDPNSPLDQTLMQWEKAMTGLQSFMADIQRVKVDRLFKGVEVYTGDAKFVKGQSGQPSRASLHLKREKPPVPPNGPEIYERYLCTGNFFYTFHPGERVLRYYELPKPKQGQITDDNFLGLLLGMRAVDLKARYDVTYIPAPPDQPEQAKWYHFLRILPKEQGDKSDFSEARLTLSAVNFLPRQLWFQQPNNDVVTWDIPNVKINVHIPLTEFAQPTVPKGWQLEKGDRATKVRN